MTEDPTTPKESSEQLPEERQEEKQPSEEKSDPKQTAAWIKVAGAILLAIITGVFIWSWQRSPDLQIADVKVVTREGATLLALELYNQGEVELPASGVEFTLYQSSMTNVAGKTTYKINGSLKVGSRGKNEFEGTSEAPDGSVLSATGTLSIGNNGAWSFGLSIPLLAESIEKGKTRVLFLQMPEQIPIVKSSSILGMGGAGIEKYVGEGNFRLLDYLQDRGSMNIRTKVRFAGDKSTSRRGSVVFPKVEK